MTDQNDSAGEGARGAGAMMGGRRPFVTRIAWSLRPILGIILAVLVMVPDREIQAKAFKSAMIVGNLLHRTGGR